MKNKNGPKKQKSSVPYKPSLQNLVGEKQAWSEQPAENRAPPNFQGWHQRGYLPHRDQPGLSQLVTFRLHDSLPASRQGEWETFLKLEDNREKRKQLENYLDRGAGECWLAWPEIAKCAEDALRFFDGQRYQLLAWVIMPNHVHVLVDVHQIPLSKLIQSWKQFIAREANKLLKREGTFWQREYWDTYMRDTDQSLKAVKYIESNPVKANLARDAKDWPWSSTRFRDNYGRLVLPGAPTSSRLLTQNNPHGSVMP